MTDPKKFKELTPESLADLYSNRPSRKRVVIDHLLNTLDDMHAEYIEAAVDHSGLRDAKQVLDHIMGMK